MKQRKSKSADLPVRVEVTVAENVTEEERRRAAWVFDRLADLVIERTQNQVLIPQPHMETEQ